jgi:hypothetical protein
MRIYAEISALFALWLVFVTVFSVWVVRIAMTLSRLHRAEIAYRTRLATTIGAAVRERPGASQSG